MEHEIECSMIWTDQEALTKEHEQTAKSACGLSAVINILTALKYESMDYDIINTQVKVNKRIPECDAGKTTLMQYLESRSKAGMNASEMIENVERVTEKKVTGRFFSFYPARNIDIFRWLSEWIKKGAIPVALLNLQKTRIHGITPDAWHHQMIYGCDESKIYLTNPVEHKPLETMMRELTSESVLKVRRIDVIKRFNANPIQNSVELEQVKKDGLTIDERWLKMNVGAQISDSMNNYEMFIQEFKDSNKTAQMLDQHIEIPASYVPGITLFAYKNSNIFTEISHSNELDVLL